MAAAVGELLSLVRTQCKEPHANGRLGFAQCPILNTTITVNSLKMRGYLSALERYSILALQPNEPLYMPPKVGSTARARIVVLR